MVFVSDMYVVYGRESCGYCQKAKELLDEKGLEYIYFDVDDEKNKKKLKQMLPHNAKITLPQIFTYAPANLVGGYEDLLKDVEKNS